MQEANQEVSSIEDGSAERKAANGSVEREKAQAGKRFTFKNFLDRKSPLRSAAMSKTPKSAVSRASSLEKSRVVEMTILDQLTAKKNEPDLETMRAQLASQNTSLIPKVFDSEVIKEAFREDSLPSEEADNSNLLNISRSQEPS